MIQLSGIHHLTAITADAPGNRRFYTGTLGLRLVKKTVNQDDVSAYHLFYADGIASPGTDMTFFDWPAPPERRGNNGVTRTGLRVPPASLEWWQRHLEEAGAAKGGIVERDGRATLDLEDPEGQRLSLIADATPREGQPWADGPVPAEHQILGLGPIVMTVPDLARTEAVLTRALNMRKVRDYPDPTSDAHRVHVFQMNGEGPAAELHVAVRPDLRPGSQGAGAVHHVAFRTPDDDQYLLWAERLTALRIPNSGEVDRFYFRSLYFREPGGVLFEIATDGPGFATDEPLATLGERLALPPFLEGRRAEIEAGLKPL